MGGGVHPAEWIFPIVGATHAAYNMSAQAIDVPDAKLVTPGSRTDKERVAESERQHLSDVAAGEAQQAAADSEAKRIAGMPDNVRKRAVAASQALGATGNRKSASQYLSGA